MAARVPIVASDLSSIREILTDGDNALLVQPNEPRALAEGIQKMLNHRPMAERLAQKAYEDVSIYTWENRAERIIHFLRSVKGSPC